MPVFQRTLIPVFKISLLPKPESSGKPLGQLLQMCNSYHEAFFFFLDWTFLDVSRECLEDYQKLQIFAFKPGAHGLESIKEQMRLPLSKASALSDHVQLPCCWSSRWYSAVLLLRLKTRVLYGKCGAQQYASLKHASRCFLAVA